MRRLILSTIVVCLVMLPFQVKADSPQNAMSGAPVSQTLVREGDFAVELVDALNLGKAQNEAQAENTLASVGIAPRNGWIADYPMTPDIIVEVENAAGSAANSGKVAMSRTAAVQKVQMLSDNLGLPVTVAGDDWDRSTPPQDSSAYSDPTVINDYYYTEGPPVVTYYTPPWDYYYLYSWVPFPFWCAGAFFGGYFILNDFYRVVTVNNGFYGHGYHHDWHGEHGWHGDGYGRVTNHYRDSVTGRMGTVDAAARSTGNAWRSASDAPHISGFHTQQARDSAQSIFTHSTTGAPSGGMRNLAAGRESTFRSSFSPNLAPRSTGQIPTSTNSGPGNFAGGAGSRMRPPSPEHFNFMGTNRGERVTPPRGRDFGTFARSSGFDNSGRVSVSRAFHDGGGSFSSPHWNGGASLGTSHSGGSSFAGFHSGGGFSGGFHGSGFSGGGFGHGGR